MYSRTEKTGAKMAKKKLNQPTACDLRSSTACDGLRSEERLTVNRKLYSTFSVFILRY